MLVPRSFRYTVAPPMRDFDEKEPRRSKKTVMPKSEAKPTMRPHSPARSRTEPTRAPTPPVDVPTPERTATSAPKKMPIAQSRTRSNIKRKEAKHDPNALPPAVAALLAVTQIPRPKPNQFRRRQAPDRRISIDELVNEWKSEEPLKGSYSSSPALSMLLENDDEDEQSTPQAGTPEEDLSYQRSTSLESVPSLEEDNRSIMSSGSLPTPDSLRSRKSYSNLRKERLRSSPASVECISEHPLVPCPSEDDEPDDGLLLAARDKSRPPTPKQKSSFKSNLTTSFQALKNAFVSFSVSSVSPSQRSISSPMSDDMLWSHPFLFPRFSPEVRPAIEGTPTQAQRRYLNPLPLTFEEQEAPYQLALHAPYLAEHVDGAPTIQMQTYSRGRRKVTTKRSASPDPQSEAGRALAGAGGVRQREPRENSNFLRVVVLEMNMRREGKLEYGRAKIWLPPRQVSRSPEDRGRVPKRWVGVSAY